MPKMRFLRPATLAIAAAACSGNIDGRSDVGTGGGSVRPGPPDERPPKTPAACSESGPSRLRQLTRLEYENTVQDLLGVPAVGASLFPPDTKVGAFDHNAAAVVTSQAAEAYATAAQTVSRAAPLDALLGCDPVKTGETTCAAGFVERFGQRAFRRPLAAAELERWRAVYQNARGALGLPFPEAIRTVIEGMLQSPQFLYHVERGDPARARGELRPLTPHELASRLSFTFLRSMPDGELMAAAAANRLATDAEIEAQARRLLGTTRARAVVRGFFAQWLELANIGAVEKSRELYPSFDARLAGFMRAETDAFLDHVLWDGEARLPTLLSARFSLVPRELLKHYGLTPPAGMSPTVRVELPEGTRAGLFTQASFLTAHAAATSISPVLLGRFVRQELLCQHVPDPPPGANSELPNVDPTLSARERLAPHTADPGCASCHRLMDPIGFAFSRYDAIGRYQARSPKGDAIDASGELVGTRDADGKFDGAVPMIDRLAGSAEVHGCFARQWFRFALGRLELDQEDACTLDTLGRDFATAKHDVRELMVAITKSVAFRSVRRPCAGGTP